MDIDGKKTLLLSESGEEKAKLESPEITHRDESSSDAGSDFMELPAITITGEETRAGRSAISERSASGADDNGSDAGNDFIELPAITVDRRQNANLHIPKSTGGDPENAGSDVDSFVLELPAVTVKGQWDTRNDPESAKAQSDTDSEAMELPAVTVTIQVMTIVWNIVNVGLHTGAAIIKQS